MALPVAFGLSALPPELLLRVLRLLDIHSLTRLSVVNKHFHNTTSDSTLWKHLFLRDFKGKSKFCKYEEIILNITIKKVP